MWLGITKLWANKRKSKICVRENLLQVPNSGGPHCGIRIVCLGIVLYSISRVSAGSWWRLGQWAPATIVSIKNLLIGILMMAAKFNRMCVVACVTSVRNVVSALPPRYLTLLKSCRDFFWLRRRERSGISTLKIGRLGSAWWPFARTASAAGSQSDDLDGDSDAFLSLH